MKLKVLLAGLLLAVLGAGAAQAQGVHAGLEAGANFNNFIGADASSLGSYKLGLVGGGFLDLELSKSFSIRPEILYEQKGVHFSQFSESTVDDYIEVPILLKLSLGTPGFNPGILLGPAISLNTLSQRVSDGGDVIQNFSDTSSLDLALVGGIQVDIDKFFVNGRYELGLSSIDTEGDKVYNGTLTFLVGYTFL